MFLCSLGVYNIHFTIVCFHILPTLAHGQFPRAQFSTSFQESVSSSLAACKRGLFVCLFECALLYFSYRHFPCGLLSFLDV